VIWMDPASPTLFTRNSSEVLMGEQTSSLTARNPQERFIWQSKSCDLRVFPSTVGCYSSTWASEDLISTYFLMLVVQLSLMISLACLLGIFYSIMWISKGSWVLETSRAEIVHDICNRIHVCVSIFFVAEDKCAVTWYPDLYSEA